MDKEQQTTPIVEAWLKGTSDTPYGTEMGVGRVKSRVRQTRQRGRWWPLPSFKRKAASTAVIPSTEFQPSPIPASNGHTPTVLGRTQSMFSPVKAITTGAIAFALGGALLIAQPFDQQGGSVPGAETDTAAVPATWVTGEYTFAPTCTSPTSEVDGIVHHMWGADCDPQIWTTSDPRLTGTAVAFWNADVYEPDADVFRGDPGTNISVITGAYHVRNEAGGWECRTNHLVHGYGWYPRAETGETAMCVGNGENKGLSAILVLDGPAGPKSVVGLIFPGDAPPPPERPAAE